MKKHTKILIIPLALILSVTVLCSTGCFGCVGCTALVGLLGTALGGNISISTDSSADSTTESSSASSESESGQSSNPARTDYDLTVPVDYVEYDPTEFYEMCDELTDLASGTDSDSVIEMYDKIYEEYEFISDNYNAMYISYYQNTSDEYWAAQYTACEEDISDISDRALCAIKNVCDGPCADKFKKHVGDDAFEAFDSYEPLTDEQAELNSQEQQLILQYDQLSSQVENSQITDSEFYEKAGDIYVQLVQIRTKIANSYGYDSYADYADELIYSRDYTTEDVENFHEAVKQISSRVYDLVYNSTAYMGAYYFVDQMSTENMISNLQTYADKISPIASSAAKTLIDQKLYDIDDKDTMFDAGFTTEFSQDQVPFIYLKSTDGTGFTELSHEFGHFCATIQNPNPNILVYGYGSLDISEIHSNGLMMLYSYYYNNIFGSYGTMMRTFALTDCLLNVTEGCLYDEFQREVYNNPDMTIDEINDLFEELCGEYGVPYSDDYIGWCYVSHNFESPMYYLSYATSGLIALQIWGYTTSNMELAVDTWTSLVEAGSYDYGYMELMDKLGLTKFNNETSVIMLCNTAISYAENNSTTYQSYSK